MEYETFLTLFRQYSHNLNFFVTLLGQSVFKDAKHMKIFRLLTICLFTLCSSISTALAQTQTIAHRGYWQTEGSAQNSLASLQAAERLGLFGSECDVYLCADGELMVFHDPSVMIDGQKRWIEETPSSVLKTHTLKNGETMPTFDQYLQTLKQCPTIRLIIELKSQTLSETQQTELAQKILDKVQQAGLSDRVEYIAFNLRLCQEVHRLDPEAQVAYLNGDLNPPQIKALGLTGLDYHTDVYKAHPQWIREARELGLKSNVWTVNPPEDLQYFIRQGVDYITTDRPDLLQSMLQETTAR